MRTYSDPTRESDPMSLPDVEVFYSDVSEQTPDTVFYNEYDDEPYGSGYFYWYCFPGCLPDSSPFGPFETEQEAIDHCREQCAC